MEVPSLIPGKEKETLRWGPLSWQFNHLLVTQDFAAEYLAEWTLRNVPSNAFHKKPPRMVALVLGTARGPRRRRKLPVEPMVRLDGYTVPQRHAAVSAFNARYGEMERALWCLSVTHAPASLRDRARRWWKPWSG